MATQWGRKETVIWPPHTPIYTYGAVFMAVVLMCACVWCRFTFGTTPLMQAYTPTYLKSWVTQRSQCHTHGTSTGCCSWPIGSGLLTLQWMRMSSMEKPCRRTAKCCLSRSPIMPGNRV